MELVDSRTVFERTGFNAFAKVLADGGAIKALAAPGAGTFSRKELDKLIEEAKGRGAAGLVWIVVEADGAVRSPVEKFLSPAEIAGIVAATGAAEGDLVCIVADRTDRANVALDGLRRDLAVRLDLIPENAWAFCWMVEPPLFEWSDEEGRWVSVHHPFTSPAGDDLDARDREGSRLRPGAQRVRDRRRQHPDPSGRRPATDLREPRDSPPNRSTTSSVT